MRCNLLLWLRFVGAALFMPRRKSVGVRRKRPIEGLSASSTPYAPGLARRREGLSGEDGAMVGRGGDVFTASQYANFILRFEFTAAGGKNA